MSARIPLFLLLFSFQLRYAAAAAPPFILTELPDEIAGIEIDEVLNVSADGRLLALGRSAAPNSYVAFVGDIASDSAEILTSQTEEFRISTDGGFSPSGGKKGIWDIPEDEPQHSVKVRLYDEQGNETIHDVTLEDGAGFWGEGLDVQGNLYAVIRAEGGQFTNMVYLPDGSTRTLPDDTSDTFIEAVSADGMIAFTHHSGADVTGYEVRSNFGTEIVFSEQGPLRVLAFAGSSNEVWLHDSSAETVFIRDITTTAAQRPAIRGVRGPYRFHPTVDNTAFLHNLGRSRDRQASFIDSAGKITSLTCLFPNSDKNISVFRYVNAAAGGFALVQAQAGSGYSREFLIQKTDTSRDLSSARRYCATLKVRFGSHCRKQANIIEYSPAEFLIDPPGSAVFTCGLQVQASNPRGGRIRGGRVILEKHRRYAPNPKPKRLRLSKRGRAGAKIRAGGGLFGFSLRGAVRKQSPLHPESIYLYVQRYPD